MSQPLWCIRTTQTDRHGRVRLKEKCGQPVRCAQKGTYRFKGEKRCHRRNSFYGSSVSSAVGTLRVPSLSFSRLTATPGSRRPLPSVVST